MTKPLQSSSSSEPPASINIVPRRTIVFFPGKYYDEEVILLCRRFLLSFLFVVFIMLLLIPSPGITLFLFKHFLNINLLANDANIILFIISTTIYYLLLALITFISWINYYFDATIITNRRILDIDQISIFDRKISETNLIDIKETHTKQKGLLQNLFNYGSVHIQIPATLQNIVINDVVNPREVASIINDLVAQKHRLMIKDMQKTKQQDDKHP